MKTSMSKPSSLAHGVLFLGLVACGSDATPGGDTTGGDTTQDAVTDTRADTTDVTPDTTLDTVPEVRPDTAPDTVVSACDQQGFAGTTAFFEKDDEAGFISFGVEASDAYVTIEFYDFGDGSPLTGPGTYPIGGNADDQNYETCTTCVLLHTGCTTDTCARSFYGTKGQIEVTALDRTANTVTAKLVGFEGVEVTIDENTFVSTPVPGGQTWCIASLDIVYTGP